MDSRQWNLEATEVFLLDLCVPRVGVGQSSYDARMYLDFWTWSILYYRVCRMYGIATTGRSRASGAPWPMPYGFSPRPRPRGWSRAARPVRGIDRIHVYQPNRERIRGHLSAAASPITPHTGEVGRRGAHSGAVSGAYSLYTASPVSCERKYFLFYAYSPGHGRVHVHVSEAQTHPTKGKFFVEPRRRGHSASLAWCRTSRTKKITWVSRHRLPRPTRGKRSMPYVHKDSLVAMSMYHVVHMRGWHRIAKVLVSATLAARRRSAPCQFEGAERFKA